MHLHIIESELPEALKLWGADQSFHQRQHVGTHLDVYNHTKIMLNSPMKTYVIDVRSINEIDIEVIKEKDFEKESFVIFRTGKMEQYGYGNHEYMHEEIKPYLKDGLIDELLNRGVKLIGIDYHGIQHGKDHKKIDMYVEEKGGFVIENLQHLDKVPSEFFANLKWKQYEEVSAVKIEIDVI